MSNEISGSTTDLERKHTEAVRCLHSVAEALTAARLEVARLTAENARLRQLVPEPEPAAEHPLYRAIRLGCL